LYCFGTLKTCSQHVIHTGGARFVPGLPQDGAAFESAVSRRLKGAVAQQFFYVQDPDFAAVDGDELLGLKFMQHA